MDQVYGLDMSNIQKPGSASFADHYEFVHIISNLTKIGIVI
jgi:hypothetical protein